MDFWSYSLEDNAFRMSQTSRTLKNYHCRQGVWHRPVFRIKESICLLLLKPNFLHIQVTREWPYFYTETDVFEASNGLVSSLSYYHIHACFSLPLRNFRETPLGASSMPEPKQHRNILNMISCVCCRQVQTAMSTISLKQNEGQSHLTLPLLLIGSL